MTTASKGALSCAAILMAACIAAGWILNWSAAGRVAMRAAARSGAQLREEHAARLRARISFAADIPRPEPAIAADSTVQQAAVPAATTRADRITALRAIAQTHKPGGTSLTDPPPAYSIGLRGELTPRFGELFELAPAETADLQEKLSLIAREVEAAIASTTQARAADDGTFIIQTSPISNSELYRDKFLGALKSTLGGERYDIWATLVAVDHEGGPEGLLGSFGASVVTVRCTKSPGVPYFAHEEVLSPAQVERASPMRQDALALNPRIGWSNSTGTSGRSRQLGTASKEEFLAFLGPHARFLPPDF